MCFFYIVIIDLGRDEKLSGFVHISSSSSSLSCAAIKGYKSLAPAGKIEPRAQSKEYPPLKTFFFRYKFDECV